MPGELSSSGSKGCYQLDCNRLRLTGWKLAKEENSGSLPTRPEKLSSSGSKGRSHEAHRLAKELFLLCRAGLMRVLPDTVDTFEYGYAFNKVRRLKPRLGLRKGVRASPVGPRRQRELTAVDSHRKQLQNESPRSICPSQARGMEVARGSGATLWSKPQICPPYGVEDCLVGCESLALVMCQQTWH